MEFDDALERIGMSEETIEFATTPGRAFILLAQLQLALRHPGNTGPSVEVVRGMVDHLLEAICTKVPEVETAVRAIVEAGWNPDYDIPRGEFATLPIIHLPDELD